MPSVLYIIDRNKLYTNIRTIFTFMYFL